jgi:hypothetical protein
MGHFGGLDQEIVWIYLGDLEILETVSPNLGIFMVCIILQYFEVGTKNPDCLIIGGLAA